MERTNPKKDQEEIEIYNPMRQQTGGGDRTNGKNGKKKRPMDITTSSVDPRTVFEKASSCSSAGVPTTAGHTDCNTCWRNARGTHISGKGSVLQQEVRYMLCCVFFLYNNTSYIHAYKHGMTNRYYDGNALGERATHTHTHVNTYIGANVELRTVRCSSSSSST